MELLEGMEPPPAPNVVQAAASSRVAKTGLVKFRMASPGLMSLSTS
jgi:hypothetical protein